LHFTFEKNVGYLSTLKRFTTSKII